MRLTLRPCVMRWRSILFGIAALCAGADAGAKDLIIHAGALIDGVNETPRGRMSIVIHDDRIVAVENR